jgi:hypothetical protein
MLNDIPSNQIPGASVTYESTDKVADDDEFVEYSRELSASLQAHDMPPHSLTLKIGDPIVLLCDLKPSLDLNYGSRLIVHALHRHTIQARVVSSKHEGTEVIIPRVRLTSSDQELPSGFNRFQFPVRPIFDSHNEIARSD